MQSLPKRSDSAQATSAKYYIPCSRITRDRPTTEAWLEVVEQLKPTNFEDKNRVLLGVLEKHNNVVIKIGESETLEKEYRIGQALHDARVDGFLRHVCLFKCDDDYREHPAKDRKHLCRGEGERMSCLVMPYARLGSLHGFDFRGRGDAGLKALKSLLKQAYDALAGAYEAIGLVHNDAHAKNVLVVEKRNPSGFGVAFVDLENALLSRDKGQRQFVYRDFSRLITDLHYTTSTNANGMLQVAMRADECAAANVGFDEGRHGIFEAIDRLVFGEIMPVGVLRYDPGVW